MRQTRRRTLKLCGGMGWKERPGEDETDTYIHTQQRTTRTRPIQKKYSRNKLNLENYKYISWSDKQQGKSHLNCDQIQRYKFQRVNATHKQKTRTSNTQKCNAKRTKENTNSNEERRKKLEEKKKRAREKKTTTAKQNIQA